VRPTVSAATPSVAAPAPAVAAAPQLAPPSRVSLRIDSRPAEAEVVRVADGVVLGRTPLVLDLPAGHDAVSFRLKKRGYHSEDVDLLPEHDGSATVVLARRRADLPQSPSTSAPTAAGRSQPRKSVKDGALDPFGVD
jgi:hypothetical protein